MSFYEPVSGASTPGFASRVAGSAKRYIAAGAIWLLAGVVALVAGDSDPPQERADRPSGGGRR